jgi:cobalt/nickel transport system permease protein
MTTGMQFEAPAPDYALAGVPDILAYILSAIAGVAILLILFKLVSLVGKDRRKANV